MYERRLRPSSYIFNIDRFLTQKAFGFFSGPDPECDANNSKNDEDSDKELRDVHGNASDVVHSEDSGDY